jgi:nucleoside-diphosphate-sugar epimerase
MLQWDGITELTSLPDDAFHRVVDKIVLGTTPNLPRNFRTAIVCPCTIYGPGRGPLNTRSMQVYSFATTVLQRGRGFLVGEGENIWHQVHVQDLSSLYLSLAEAAGEGGGNATWDNEGYYFAENGSFVWGDIQKAVIKAAHERGYIPSDQIDALDYSAVSQLKASGPYSWGSNSRGESIRAKKLLGWNPVKPTLLELVGDIVDLQGSSLNDN